MKGYKYDIRNLSSAEYDKWYSLMSEEKQQRVDRFRFEDDKKRTVAGEMLARNAISEWCNVPAEAIQFDKNEYGKPFAVGLAVEFNISHSGDYVVCAVDDKPVGIDIQKIGEYNSNVAKRVCNEKEFIHIENRLDKASEFTKLWTQKEAVLKMHGTGIASGNIKNCLYNFKVQSDRIKDCWVSVCEHA